MGSGSSSSGWFRPLQEFEGLVDCKVLPKSLMQTLLKGSWDLVTWVIHKVAILIITHSPN